VVHGPGKGAYPDPSRSLRGRYIRTGLAAAGPGWRQDNYTWRPDPDPAPEARYPNLPEEAREFVARVEAVGGPSVSCAVPLGKSPVVFYREHAFSELTARLPMIREALVAAGFEVRRNLDGPDHNHLEAVLEVREKEVLRCKACGLPAGTCEDPELCEDRIVGVEAYKAEQNAERDAAIERSGGEP
jgi:hypothetical protein